MYALRSSPTMFSLCAILLLAAVASVSPAAADEPARDAEDLFYLADDGLIVLRLDVRVDGKSLRENWNAYVDKVMSDLDQDGDGRLSAAEAQRLPSRDVLMRTGVLPRADAQGAVPADRDWDGSVTREELADYFRRIGLTPFQTVVANPQPTQRPGGIASMPAQQQEVDIFSHLDADADGKLSREELASARQRLRKLDLDDDETISIDELRPLQSPFAAGIAGRQQPAQPLFTTLSSAGSPQRLVAQLLERYDGKNAAAGQDAAAKPEPAQKDNSLSREEIGLSPEAYAEADADGNGLLDFTELEQFVRRPSPHVELVVRIGERGADEQVVEAINLSETLKPSLRRSSDGTAAVMLGRTLVEISVPSNWPVNSEALLKARFKQLDADGNGYLEPQEVRQFADVRDSFALMDADGDGKVFEEEMLSFFGAVEAAARSRTVLNIGAVGRNLFEMLDLDRDRRIGPREFQLAADSFALWDADGDGYVAQSELPTHVRLTFGRGRSAGVSGVVAAPGAAPRASTAGPVWFQKMDRNGDGDVSRREFIGSRREFDRLDADKDGLIDADEALLAK